MDQWIEEAIELDALDDPRKDYLCCTVCLRDGTVVGSVGCSWYREFEVVGVGKEYRQLDFALESPRAYVDFFFAHYPIRRLIATIPENNTASWTVIAKAGFRLTGRRLWQDYDDERVCMYRFYEKVSE